MAVTELLTTRLRLLPWTHGDIDPLRQLWVQPDVRRFLWDDIVITRERASEVVEGAIVSQAGAWRIELREQPGVLTGFVAFFPMPERAGCELLYGLAVEYWGQGFATEASRAALAYAFSCGLFDQVWARTDLGNTASARVMERLGMTFEGEIRIGELPALSYSLSREVFLRH